MNSAPNHRHSKNRGVAVTPFLGLSKPRYDMDAALVCDGTGAGRDGKGQDDVLPPLMPGLPARRQG